MQKRQTISLSESAGQIHGFLPFFTAEILLWGRRKYRNRLKEKTGKNSLNIVLSFGESLWSSQVSPCGEYLPLLPLPSSAPKPVVIPSWLLQLSFKHSSYSKIFTLPKENILQTLIAFVELIWNISLNDPTLLFFHNILLFAK